ncbi:MAG: carboxypeptidase regulatory-like domain-containing protein [Acidimicrobiales bacterium]|nr:carboxypeptidase regulatory-like domain-containing protein [Acidimicrobiales bacterium]
MGHRAQGRWGWAALAMVLVVSLAAVVVPHPAAATVPALRAESVVTGGFHSCALMEDDSTRCWGADLLSLGYPGHNGSVGDDEVPAEVGPIDLGAGRRVVSLGAGLSHTCAVVDDGSVRCWGQDEDGKLGNSTAPEQGDPATAPPVDLGGVAAGSVDAGYDHSCAVLVDGDLRCWGRSRSGDLGLGTTDTIGDDEAVASVPPVDLGPGRTATAVAVGLAHTCALLDDGSVRCWGAGAHGENGLGTGIAIGDDETPAAVPPVDLGPGRTAVALAASYHTTCALLDDGSVRCWGVGQDGLLGDGAGAGDGVIGDDETPGSFPPVELGAGRTAVAIGAGGWHTCAVLDDGSMRCWGLSDRGQLGYGTTATVGDDETPAAAGPVDLGTGRTAVTVDGGQQHTCAVLDDGSVRCWGQGASGILGSGNLEDIGDDETPGSVGPVDLGSEPIAELAVAVSVDPAEATIGEEVAVDVTVRNTGGVALTDVVIDLPAAPGCSGPAGDLALRAAVTVDCTRLLGEADLGPLTLAPTATSAQTPDPTAADPVTVSVLDTPSGLEGTVRDSRSGDPVPGAFVAVLRSSDYRLEGGTVADDQGRYRVELEPGEYFLYLLDPAGGHAAAVATAPALRVVVPHAMGTADVVMAPSRGTVGGTVTGGAGPLGGALALVLERGGTVERVVAADAAGHYEVAGIGPGEHLVGFADLAGGHEVRFHAGSPSVPGATPVAVTAGERTSVDGVLPAQAVLESAGTVAGTVTEAGGGRPVAGAVVLALRAADFRLARATTADDAGRYELGLPAGAHFLVFVDPTGGHGAEWYDGRPNTALDEADPVTAPATADAALAPTRGSIAGAVTDDPAGTPVVGAWAFAIGPTGVAGGAATGADGAYRIDGLVPGPYRVTLVDPSGGRAQEYVDDKADYASADVIEVTAGGAATADAAITRPDVPLAMGGTGNTVGNDPEQWAVPGYERPHFWLNVAGPDSTKVNGDRYTAGDCTGAYSGCAGGTNLDYAEEGYLYRISVDEAATADDLHVQVFDPSFLDVGNTCSTGMNLPTPGSTWTTRAATLVAQGAPPDAATRYAAGNNQWCVADGDYGGTDVETTYLVRAPDGTPEIPLDNPVVCAVTFGAYDESVYALLNQADGYKDGPIGPEHLRFVDHFRRWTDVCEVPAAEVVAGDYLLQVTTTADQSDPPTSLSRHDPAVATGGYNKYAVRAGAGDPGSDDFAAGIQVAADGRFPIYVNQAGAGTTSGFSLARVPSRHAGRTLEVELFDVADGANASLTVVPPPDRTGSPLPACSFTRDTPTPEVTTSATCTLTGLTNAAYNGRTVTVRLPLPADYRCETRSDDGCRFRLRLDFGAGMPTDQTTWTARIR